MTDEIQEKCGLTVDGEADSRAEDVCQQESGLNTNYDSSDGAIPTHRCDGCDYETMSSSALGRHTYSCQGGGKGKGSGVDPNGSSSKMFECDICQMRFSNGANMRRHKMRHTGVKPYECRVCGKRFFRKDHLAEHTTTRAKALPWACPICHRGFQRQIAMRAHFQNEHVTNVGGDGANGEVKCCPLCTYKGASMKSLRVHFYNRHGIDLDRPTVSPSVGAVAAVLSNGVDGDRGGGNVTPPMHFLTPHIEISTQNSPQMNGIKSDDSEAVDLQDQDSSPRGSPDSMDSNAPTSSLSEIIKTEPCSDGGDTYDCCPTNGNGRCSPVNLTVSSRHKEESALVRLLVNGTASSSSTTTATTGGTAASPTNLVVRSTPTTIHHRTSLFSTVVLSSGGDTCGHCKIRFPDRTLYFLHKGCHAEGNPWKCNICGEQTSNVYDFNSHLLSSKHQ